MASVESILQSYLKKPRLNLEQDWWSRNYEALFAESARLVDKSRERKKNTVINSLNILPQFASMISDEASLVNYEKFTEELVDNASKHSETAIYVPLIQGVSSNLREDYNMYTDSMEQGAKFIDDPNFITDMQGWDDLENTVKNITLDDNTTPKYQGNGTFLFLTEQNNAINSILSKIQNSAKGTQFRYNKAGNKYTDQEMIEKLTQYQKSLGVAVETSMGDGIITSNEAEFIMLGNLDAYQKAKKSEVSRIDKDIGSVTRLKTSLVKQLDRAELKAGGKFGDETIASIKQSIINEQGTDPENQIVDPEIEGRTREEVIADINKRIVSSHAEVERLQAVRRGWTGRNRSVTKTSNSENEDYGSNIYSEVETSDEDLVSTTDDKGKVITDDKGVVTTDDKVDKLGLGFAEDKPNLSSYAKYVGTPTIDDLSKVDSPGETVHNLPYFKKLEELVEEAKLGKSGRGKGYKVLNIIKRKYSQKLNKYLRRYGKKGTSSEEYWNTGVEHALDDFLKDKDAIKYIKILESMISKKIDRFQKK